MTALASDARNAGMQLTYPPRAAVTAWIFFDWAAQPYFTLITTFVFAPYFATHVASDAVSKTPPRDWQGRFGHGDGNFGGA